MTPQEINLKIAEMLGKTIFIDNAGIAVGVVGNLDYTTDKALCWDLMEKLLQAKWKPKYKHFQKTYAWEKPIFDESGRLQYYDVKRPNESLLIATCEAFIEEHKDAISN